MKLLRQREIAEMLDVSQATISRMASAGDIPHIILRTGRRKKVVRFRFEDIERWIQSRAHGGPEGQRPKRKAGRIGNGLATEKPGSMQRLEPQRENEQGHGMFSPMTPRNEGAFVRVSVGE